MLGAAELDRLRPGSVFVNVSRGAVIEPDALVERLARGDVIACLDVFDPEPLPLDSPVIEMPNVFLSPHVAGVTEESRRRFFSLMVDECLRCFEGLEPLTELTREVVRLRSRRSRVAASAGGSALGEDTLERVPEHERELFRGEERAVTADDLERLPEGAEPRRGGEVRAPAEPVRPVGVVEPGQQGDGIGPRVVPAPWR